MNFMAIQPCRSVRYEAHRKMPPKPPGDHPRDNRSKKVEGRAKRRRFVQGTRAYTHALTNSIARRAQRRKKPR